MAEGQDGLGLVAIAVKGDELAVRAVRILKREGARTAVVPKKIAAKAAQNGNIVFTGKEVPTRFPNTYFRVLGNTVHVRQNPEKEKRNPQGFRTAVLDMGVRLSLLPKPPAEKRARRRNRSRYWRRQRERTGLRI